MPCGRGRGGAPWETIAHAQLDNGLHIYVDQKPGFQKSYAFFATCYGGMDMKFYLDGTWRDTPAGVAHFLGHKMFDTEDGCPQWRPVWGGGQTSSPSGHKTPDCPGRPPPCGFPGQ